MIATNRNNWLGGLLGWKRRGCVAVVSNYRDRLSLGEAFWLGLVQLATWKRPPPRTREGLEVPAFRIDIPEAV